MPDLKQRIVPAVGKRFPFRTSDVSDVIDEYLVCPHWHDQLEIIQVMKGRVLVTLDNQTFTAAENDIVYVNSGQIHSVKPLSDDARIIGLIFDEFFVTSFLEGFETKEIYNLFIKIRHRLCLFTPTHPLWEELNGSITTCYEENRKRHVCYEMAIKSHLYRIMTALVRYFDKQHYSSARRGDLSFLAFASIRPVLEYIEEHYAESIYLEELGRLVNKSPYHFSRLFKKSTGMTLPDYINMTRINMAKKWLMDNELSITEVAEKTGFCNPNYFGKVFKSITGFSPMDFRNEMTKQVLS
ncbi:AraC family transcriptional regulator [Paenibacillus aurantius]|uniref:AraC family transcriptional regulator n=1 Tax=Paenibacillus aurantius TaxID=2918900 RepID=A0AA96LA80_9BACL|nr:AraC family transcriptional regulator [Paenibacillus aurantius]WNQ09891.1 AraC family transcriptional regulator [Paenibacillus aurantius]